MMKLRPEHECQYDVVSLGEVMLRLDPVDVPFEKARTAKIWHGGGETNVSEGLSYCFGKKVPSSPVWLMMESEEISKTNSVRQELIQLISLGSVQMLKVLFQRMQKGH